VGRGLGVSAGDRAAAGGRRGRGPAQRSGGRGRRSAEGGGAVALILLLGSSVVIPMELVGLSSLVADTVPALRPLEDTPSKRGNNLRCRPSGGGLGGVLVGVGGPEVGLVVLRQEVGVEAEDRLEVGRRRRSGRLGGRGTGGAARAVVNDTKGGTLGLRKSPGMVATGKKNPLRVGGPLSNCGVETNEVVLRGPP